MESNPGDFPGFRHLRAAKNSFGLKGSEILCPSGVGNHMVIDVPGVR